MTSKKRINRDHAKKKNSPQVENEVIANYLKDLLIPAMAAQKSFYRQLNLRDRILTLPLMMAAILSLLWRDVAGVTELTRLLNQGKRILTGTQNMLQLNPTKFQCSLL